MQLLRLREIYENRIMQDVVAECLLSSNDQYGWFPLNMQMTVMLREGQGVAANLVEGSIYENGSADHLVTSFGGFLISPINLLPESSAGKDKACSVKETISTKIIDFGTIQKINRLAIPSF